jgi:hypothetical protein
MDILLSADGDLHLTKKGDITLTNSVAQKIRIRLKWWLGEWRWDEEEGLPYKDELFIKNPDTDGFEMAVREKIFEVDEVTEVKDVSVTYDRKTRAGRIRFTALTDTETIREEVEIDGEIRSN